MVQFDNIDGVIRVSTRLESKTFPVVPYSPKKPLVPTVLVPAGAIRFAILVYLKKA